MTNSLKSSPATPISTPSELEVSRVNKETVTLLEFLSLSQSSGSLTPQLLNGIDLDLQCNSDEVEATAQNCYHTVSNLDETSEEVPISEEVYMLSNVGLHDSKISCLSHADQSCNDLTYLSANHARSKYMLPHKSNTYVDLSSHLTNIVDPCTSGIRCNICDVQFSSEEAFDLHNKDKHRIKEEFLEFKCFICGKSFDNAQSLKKHEKAHEKTLLLNSLNSQWETSMNCCPLCPHVSKTKRLLKNHIIAKHSKKRKILTCNMCAFSCLKPQTLSLHLRKHKEEPKFACDQCGKLFLTMSILKRHAITHNKSQLFYCQVPNCGKSFNMRGRLTDHMRTVHRKKKPPKLIVEQMQNQGHSFSLSGPNNQNSQIPEFSQSILTECNQASTFRSELKSLETGDIVVYDIILPENEIEHFQNPNEPGVSQGFNPLVFLMESKQGKSKPQSARVRQNDVTLGKTLTNSTSSRCRQSSDKSKRTNFICGWVDCGRKFRDSYNLRMHMCTHTGEMQRACTLCRYRCVQKSALDSHIAKHLKLNKKHGIKE